MIVSIGATQFQLDLDDDRGDVVFLRLVAGKPQSVTIGSGECSNNHPCLSGLGVFSAVKEAHMDRGILES
jgi:hypothetical protein